MDKSTNELLARHTFDASSIITAYFKTLRLGFILLLAFFTLAVGYVALAQYLDVLEFTSTAIVAPPDAQT